MQQALTIEQALFMAQVRKGFRHDSCWLWTGSKAPPRPSQPLGYGYVFANGRQYLAHRIAWMMFRGDLPESAEVMHTCDVPLCVRPSHLRLGTHRHNMEDRRRKRRGGRLRGERNPRSKVSDADALLIIALRGKETQAALAERFGVSTTTISHIQTGRVRSHLTAPRQDNA